MYARIFRIDVVGTSDIDPAHIDFGPNVLTVGAPPEQRDSPCFWVLNTAHNCSRVREGDQHGSEE